MSISGFYKHYKYPIWIKLFLEIRILTGKKVISATVADMCSWLQMQGETAKLRTWKAGWHEKASAENVRTFSFCRCTLP